MALRGSTNAAKIVNYLLDHGLTENAAYGMAGNIQAESGLNPWNLQNSYESKLGYNDSTYTAAVDNGSYGNFANDKAGYGLCQWTSAGRKQGLLQLAKQSARSIGDMEMQLEWLMTELAASYKPVLSGINAAASIREASDIVLTKFERPANQSESVKKLRASYGETIKKQIGSATGGKTAAASSSGSGTCNGADSPLVSVTDWTDKNYGTRTKKITGVTIHHMAGDMTIESCMNYHKTCEKKVSANYYIGSDGRIGQAVPEAKAAWTSSSKANDMEKVTIEVANCTTDSEWRISEAAYRSLIALVADILKRNGIAYASYTGDKTGVITEHRMFSSTVCPGTTIHGYLTSGRLVTDVNAIISYGANVTADVTQTVNNLEQCYTTGNYVTVAGPMKIRNGAGTSYEQKKFQSMTASAQKQNAQYKNTGLAYYAKGTVFTAQEIRQNGSSWWARTPSGWICLADSKKVYCQKK